jgi:hypothetical protein
MEIGCVSVSLQQPVLAATLALVLLFPTKDVHQFIFKMVTKGPFFFI